MAVGEPESGHGLLVGLALMAVVGLLGAGVGALLGDLTYTPSDAPLDFGRRFSIEVAAWLGLFVGLLVGGIVWLAWRSRHQGRQQ
jgi:hypothetical protein